MDNQAFFELTQRSIAVLQLAESKGFDSAENVKACMLLSLMPVAEIFANTVGSALQWWLRSKFNIVVLLEPISATQRNISYLWYVNYYGVIKRNEDYTTRHSYELELLSGIEFAINALPPATQGDDSPKPE